MRCIAERLERRVILAANIAVVGLADRANPIQSGTSLGAYFLEATLSEAGAFSGSQYASGASGVSTAQPYNQQVTYLPDGKFTLSGASERDYDRELGGQVSSDAGLRAGWFYGFDSGLGDLDPSDSQSIDLAYAIERASTSSLSDISGTWMITWHGWNHGTSTVGDAANGTLTVSGSSFSLVGTYPSYGSDRSFSGTLTARTNGKFTAKVDGFSSDVAWFYLDKTKQVVIAGVVAESAAGGGVFVAIRQGANPTVQAVAGRYQLVTGMDYRGNEVDRFGDAGLVDLKPDGTGLYQSDVTGSSAELQWTLSGRVITVMGIYRGEQIALQLAASSSGDFALPQQVTVLNGADAGTYGQTGFAIRIGEAVSPFNVSAAYSEIRSGNAMVYLSDTGGNWITLDILESAAPELASQTAKEVVTDLDTLTGNLRVTVLVGGTVAVFFFDESTGSFACANLTTLTGTGSIQRGLVTFSDAFTGAAADLYYGGLKSNGDFVLYKLEGDTGAWSARNLGTVLRAQGLAMPQFAGELTAYVTLWGALNIVGLDADGDIQAVWNHATLPDWTTNNLSESTGAPAYTGKLAVFLTSWFAMNIAGTTPDGKMVVTWWVPEFGASWVASNFTDLFSGPFLQSSSVAAYVTSWGQMTVLGLDDNGDIRAYWWAPGFSEWAIANLNEAVVSDRRHSLHGMLTTQFTGMDEINIYGQKASGDDIRYTWDPSEPWDAENLSLIAEPW
ncbi:MAG: hypothetical protein IT435_19780 [Phycisphaerales bacterium]|nr:hypothetical protein [Phycisphaerales bacterium]